MTWLGPGKDLLRPDIFRKVAEAGFSINMSFLGDRESNLKALDLARDAGLALMIYDDRVAKLVENASLPLAPLAQVVADYRNHSAFFGYYILDEPNASKFGRLGEIVRTLAALDPLHPAYINLFPTYANAQQLGTETYEQHVAAYLAAVKPAFISYDHYPITDKGLRGDYYRNLEIIRTAALEKHLPFWAFTLSVPHAIYLQPTAARLRLQLFSDLVYGARDSNISPTPRRPETTMTGNRPSSTRKAKPTSSYDLARQVNAEIGPLKHLSCAGNPKASFTTSRCPKGPARFLPTAPSDRSRTLRPSLGCSKTGRTLMS